VIFLLVSKRHPNASAQHFAGLRKSELTRLEAAHINFSDVPKFYPVNGRDVEIPPNFLLVVKSKNRKARIVPMNPLVRTALSEAMQEAVGSGLVFSIERNGVSYNAIRGGFETACDNAGIIYGQTKPGGITWHDLRHTFATRLRGQGVHALDIMHLMGHSSVGVTAGYAHATPSVIQSAVNKLAEPRGEVVQFARRAG
jgi:integrase